MSAEKRVYSPEQKARAREYSRKRRLKPEATEYQRKYDAQRVRTPEYYSKKKERESSPEYKARTREWNRKYRQTPKFEETRRRYNASAAGRETQREYQRKRHYNMKPGEWDAMFLAQGSMCKICSRTEPVGKNWHTDHCHETGVVRGIICHCCNLMLGGAQDIVSTLESAIRYLNASL